MSRRIVLLLLIVVLAACAAPTAPAPTAPPAPTAAAPTRVAVGATPTSRAPAPTTPAPRPSATATAPALEEAELAAIEQSQRLPREKVALADQLGRGCPDSPNGCPLVARNTPLDVRVGDRQSFWVSDLGSGRNYEVSAVLRYAGPVVLMYVQEGAEFEQRELEAAARTFEQQIYPRTRALFGSEAQPGVDGDTRITILNGRSAGGGVLGYFSARDAVPKSVNRFSNEREMFFMNIDALKPGTSQYLDVLSHEFQHMIHQNEQPGAALWFNEGCSTLSEDLNGFVNQGYAAVYLSDTDTQLNAWTDSPAAAIGHYGAAQLFMRYIYAQYAGDSGLLPLVRADAGDELEAFTRLAAGKRPDIARFSDLFADWAVANLINNAQVGDGRYSYETAGGAPNLLPATVQPRPTEGNTYNGSVNQFGATYLQLPTGPLELNFNGSTTVNLVGTLPQQDRAWWSGRGDNSFSTLTRALDLRGLTDATLRFAAWYELETGYDYAFVSVSTDGGQRWQTLPGTTTTDDDPQGVNFGNGLTGVSGAAGKKISDGERGRWVEETMDLTSYAGQSILLRFWQISDEGFNAPGLLVDRISICAADGACPYQEHEYTGDDYWQAAGFVRVDGTLPQAWTLRLIRTATDGSISVEALPVDAAGQARATLGADERAVLLISATTPHTSERASFTINWQAGGN